MGKYWQGGAMRHFFGRKVPEIDWEKLTEK
jgi:hypothetical protein